MKHIILIALMALLSQRAFSQTQIKAIDAYKHIGEYVSIQDSIYAGKVYQDSICVLNIGSPADLHPFVAIVIFKKSINKIDESMIRTLIKYRAKFEGVVIATPKEYIIVVDEPNKRMRFSKAMKID